MTFEKFLFEMNDITTDKILSKISLYDLSYADIDDIPNMIDKAIVSLLQSILREGLRDEAIERLTKIKEFIEDNGLTNWSEDKLDSCLSITFEHGL